MALLKVWDGTQWVTSDGQSDPGGGGPFLPLSGGSMTGPLLLAADPTVPAEAATKQYVDNNAGITEAEGDARYLRLTGGTMTGSITMSSSAIADTGTVYPGLDVGFNLGRFDRRYDRAFFISARGVDQLAKLVVGSAGPAAGGVSVGDAQDIDGNIVLNLNTARAWRFEQRGTGAATALALMGNSNKQFFIGNDTSGDGIQLDDAMRAVLLQAANTGDRTTNLRNVMIAPSTLGGTTPAPTGGDGHILIKYTP